MDVTLLRAKMQERRMSVSDLAVHIGIDDSTFYRKLNENGEKFTVAQARAMATVLELSPEDTTAIFFSKKLAYP